MHRRHLVSASLAIVVLGLAELSLRAAPPMVRAPQTAAPPAAAEPHTAAVVQAARRIAASVAARTSSVVSPKASLQPNARADGPTLILTPYAPVVAGKARLAVYSSASDTFWCEPDTDSIVINYTCDMPAGYAQNSCASYYASASSDVEAQFNVADSAHGYLVNCFVSNAGPDSVAFAGSLTLSGGQAAWLSGDFKPGSRSAGWGVLNAFQVSTTPPTTVAYHATFSVTRCEVTPYTMAH